MVLDWVVVGRGQGDVVLELRVVSEEHCLVVG